MPTVLTPEQQKGYYASQSNAAKPLSPEEYVKSLKPTETPAGNLPPLPTDGSTPSGETGGTTQSMGDMGNLRLALRSALTEASQTKAGQRIQAMSGLTSGGASPNVIQAALGLAQKGLAGTTESMFSDTMAAYKDATEAKQKELDRINQLRSEFGSAVPSNVTDLKTALDLVAPLVDKERRAKFEKLAKDQATDNDVETWAQGLADGTYKPGNIPANIRTAVVVRADVLRKKLESDAKQEYQSQIAFRLEKKTSDFNTERSLVMQDGNLNVAEKRDVIDYIDGLEQAQKASKKTGSGGFFSFLGLGGGNTVGPTSTGGGGAF